MLDMTATVCAASYSAGFYPQIEQPLKWILSNNYSNSCNHSDVSSALGLLLDRKDPIKNMSTPITRTNFKQQLQRQQLEQQDQLFQAQKHGPHDKVHSQSIAVPRTSSPTTLPPDVPSSVLQVRSVLKFFQFCICKLGRNEVYFKVETFFYFRCINTKQSYSNIQFSA